MAERVAVVGAGVTGLTCAVLLAEEGFCTTILAGETGQRTTSAVAAAIWFPYDVEPAAKVLGWSRTTRDVLTELATRPESGVTIIALHTSLPNEKAEIPEWVLALGAAPIRSASFSAGFVLQVPLTDTTIYLDYLANRFRAAGGKIREGIHFATLEEVDSDFDLVLNCTGLGARELARDSELEPHRGQVVLVAKIPGLEHAIARDEPPLMYAIPRAHDCVFGGSNDLSENRKVDRGASAQIVAECSRALGIVPPVIVGERVGLRPFRKSGVRLERAQLRDGRPVIHNYGHGGAGFTVSWGCAHDVLRLARASAR